MPRFRLHSESYLHSNDPDDLDAEQYSAYEDFADQAAYEQLPHRRRGKPNPAGPRLAVDGKSGRVEVDLTELDAGPGEASSDEDGEDETSRDGIDLAAPYSSYDLATHGPEPTPDWLITALAARDTPLGGLKSGKEADVALLERAVPGGAGCLLAVKTYRTADHRMFHRDSGYQEGRRTRRSREGRAMAARTRFGRELLAGKWAGAEFDALSKLWRAGANVPYPVQLIGSELMMQFIGSDDGVDGVAAPRLANWEGTCAQANELYQDLVGTLEILADTGLTHGDLSPYNVLVSDGRCVLIDLPQVVDVIANPQGMTYLQRDCTVIADHFARRGVADADGELLAAHLAGFATR